MSPRQSNNSRAKKYHDVDRWKGAMDRRETDNQKLQQQLRHLEIDPEWTSKLDEVARQVSDDPPYLLVLDVGPRGVKGARAPAPEGPEIDRLMTELTKSGLRSELIHGDDIRLTCPTCGTQLATMRVHHSHKGYAARPAPDTIPSCHPIDTTYVDPATTRRGHFEDLNMFVCPSESCRFQRKHTATQTLRLCVAARVAKLDTIRLDALDRVWTNRITPPFIENVDNT